MPERAKTGLELLLSEPEIVAWLEADEADDEEEGVQDPAARNRGRGRPPRGSSRG